MTQLTREKQIEKYKDQQTRVGDKGYVVLLDWMGTDKDIVDAARISYGKGTKTVNDDRNLIRYLYRMGHVSPFEMCEVKFGIKLPIYIMRQLVRHRTASLNEVSQRYSETIDDTEITQSYKWRLQSTENKQGSSNYLTEWPEEFLHTHKSDSGEEVVAYIRAGVTNSKLVTPGEMLSLDEWELHKLIQEIYKERLKFGVAREQARKDLLLSNYTEIYWKCDLRNILHFLSLRMDSHAQLEIREYANVIYDIIKLLYPLAIEAFDDYDFRRGGLLLSQQEISCITYLNGCGVPQIDKLTVLNEFGKSLNMTKREIKECQQKLVKLGMM